MIKRSQLQFGLWLVILILGSICAQAQTTAQSSTDAQARAPWVLATATAEQVRFASPGDVVQMRLEVFATGGEKLFDSNFKFGNLLDWPLQDQQGQRLPDGSYLCTVTIKDLDGHTSHKHGTALVQAGQISRSSPEPERLSVGQRQVLEAAQKSQAQGTEANNDYFTIMPEGTAIPITTLAHDGNNGQLTTSVGALSFRAGDFFSGKNVERMRLTAEGDLGIGVDAPKSKLDVAGAIRTSEGIVFPDGSIQTSAYVAPGRSLGGEREKLKRDAQGRAITEPDNKMLESGKSLRFTPNVSGTGTTGKVTKWLDAIGTLGDSVISESGSNVGIGTASPGEKLSIGYGSNTNIAVGSATNNKSYLGSFNNNVVFAINRRVSDGIFANPGLPTASFGFYTASGDSHIRFNTSNTNGVLDTERMRIDKDGRVGIGTASPGEKLSVGYGANTDIAIGSATNNKSYLGSFNNNVVFAINRRVSDGVFANPALPTASFGFYTSSGDSSIRFNTSGTNGVLDTERMRIDRNGNVGIGTTAPTKRLHVVGDIYGLYADVTANGLAVAVSGNVISNTPHLFSAGVAGIVSSSTTNNGYGAYGRHLGGGIGLYGESARGIGVWGKTTTTSGKAGQFDGPVSVNGNLSLFDNMLRVRDENDANHGILYSSIVDGPELRGFNGFRWTTGISGATERMRLGTDGLLVVNGIGGEQVYLGGDGVANDVQLGSTNGTVNDVVLFNPTSNKFMNLKVGVLTVTGADVAEPFDVSGTEALRPGMVLAIDPDQPGRLRIVNKAYDRTVAGIISGAGGVNTGMLMSQPGSIADGSHPVALTGRVYCWADASNGPIKPGDLLTTSATPGHAMKVADHKKAQGAIIGKAMTGLKEGKGLVLVLVTLQ